MPIIFPGLDGPAALLVGVLLLWFAVYLVEIFKAVNHYRQGRAEHARRGELIVQNETLRHSRALTATHDFSYARDSEGYLDIDALAPCDQFAFYGHDEEEARQAVDRG